MKNRDSTGISFVIYLIVIILLLIHHFAFYYGHFGYDDIHYARLANEFMNGHFDPNDHYSYRLTLIMALIPLYKFFGIHDWTSMMPAFLASLLILYLIYKNYSTRWPLMVLAIGFYFVFKWNLFYSDKIMPDIFVSLFIFIAWYIYFFTRREYSKVRFYLPFMFSLCLFLAFNAKGTVILALPLFGFYFIRDILQRRFSFWKQAFLFHLLIYPLYFLLSWLGTGHAFSRFKAISTNEYFNECSYHLMGNEQMLARLGPEFFELISKELLILFLIIALAGIIKHILSKNRSSLLLPSLSIFILFLSVNFMTISLTAYNPVCLDPRHLLFITPIMAVCSTEIIANFLSRTDPYPQKRKFLMTIILVFALLLTYPSVKYAFYSKSLNYNALRKDICTLIQQVEPGNEYFGSVVFENISEYYSGFDPVIEKQMSSFKDLQIEPEDSVYKKILVRNWYLEWHANIPENSIESILKFQDYQTEILPDSLNELQLYYISKR